MSENIKEKIKEIPNNPGCYKYYDDSGKLVYVGKAKNLKKRVSSYFTKKDLDIKTRALVERVSDIQWEITGSEIEALVLESILIKRHRPKFNIKIKDDKSFLFVKIDLDQDFPQPELIRNKEKIAGRKIKYFGPFTDSKLLKEGLVILRKVFLWRDCGDSKYSYHQKRRKPCLEYYIKNCGAPCVEKVNKNNYQKGLKNLIAFFGGKKANILRDYDKEMERLSKLKQFEGAAVIRDRIKSLEHLNIVLSMDKRVKQERFKDLDRIVKKVNSDLKYNLKYRENFRIEFYDISNMAGRESVGSMVVWQDGAFAHDQYRKFKIKFTEGMGDTGMMEEVLERRINDKKWGKPDLIILDGGKTQLGVVWRLFRKLGVSIPLLSLAKREEEVLGIYKRGFKKVNIAKDSSEGYFIQKIRDESHRFAINYHKILRSKKSIKSKLDEILGVGPVVKKKLIKEFGSVNGIIGTGLDKLEKVVGEKLAKRIKENL